MFEPVQVTDERISCSGNGPALGHPRIFLTVESTKPTVCPYCSKTFVLRPAK